MISFGGHDKARIFQPLAIGRFPTEPIALSTPTKTSALLGPWLVWRHHASEGPEIKVHFVSAEGLIAGKTPVLCRSGPVGTVAKIELADDLKGVVITVNTSLEAVRLLVEDSQIWIVRAATPSAGHFRTKYSCLW